LYSPLQERGFEIRFRMWSDAGCRLSEVMHCRGELSRSIKAIHGDLRMDAQKRLIERGIWAPFWFCTFLCLLTLVGGLTKLFMTGNGGAEPIAFLGFLPMCFYFVGLQMARLQAENERLQARIFELEHVWRE
jgi:hypothetical protein